VDREAELPAPTGVGSGDLLGHINVTISNKSWRIKTLINLNAPNSLAAQNLREPKLI
jgi:hypothetical protein